MAFSKAIDTGEQRMCRPLRSARPGMGMAMAVLVALVALVNAAWTTAALAEDALGNLGSAFRPQAIPVAPGAAGAGNAGANAAAAPASSAEPAAAQVPLAGLRVVVTGAGRSPLAAIDGKIVRLGDTVNGMRVAEISARGVVLVGEGGAKERLGLSPAAVKRQHPSLAAQDPKGVPP